MNGTLIGEDAEFVGLVEALRLLSSDADKQVGALDVFRDIAVQIETGDNPVLLLDKKLLKQGAIEEQTASFIREIDEIFNQLVIQREADYFTETALREAEVWKKLRKLAKAALASLGF